MIQGFMTQFLIQLVFVAVLILVVIMVVIRMGRLGGNAASAVKAMADPVPGTLLVTAISMPSRSAVFQMTRLTGVISAEGVDAFAIQHNGLVRTAQKGPDPDHDQVQGSEELDDGERRRGRDEDGREADPETEAHDGRGRKAAAVPQAAEGVPEVLEQCRHGASSRGATGRVVCATRPS